MTSVCVCVSLVTPVSQCNLILLPPTWRKVKMTTQTASDVGRCRRLPQDGQTHNASASLRTCALIVRACQSGLIDKRRGFHALWRPGASQPEGCGFEAPWGPEAFHCGVCMFRQALWLPPSVQRHLELPLGVNVSVTGCGFIHYGLQKMDFQMKRNIKNAIQFNFNKM